MRTTHARNVRRHLLLRLYERYMSDPLEMLSPEDFLGDGTLTKEELIPNAFYLHDRGFIELLIGYNPPLFAAARITANGIDLVENAFEFDRRFPPASGEIDEATAEAPYLLERLVEEADFSPLDGEKRACLLRDIQYLRDEMSRPVERWRPTVVKTILEWIGAHRDGEAASSLPSLPKLHDLIDAQFRVQS